VVQSCQVIVTPPVYFIETLVSSKVWSDAANEY